MLGFVAPLLVSAATVMPSASVTCAESPASCDAAWPTALAEGADEGPRDYATPAEVDCPSPIDGPMAANECDPVAPVPLDAWYRVSRFPESERPAGAWAPAPRRARAFKPAAFTGGLPDAGHWSRPDVQPVALSATLPTRTAPSRRAVFFSTAQEILARVIAPPDRPPRA